MGTATVKATKISLATLAVVAGLSLGACSTPPPSTPTALENGASDIKTGSFKIKNAKNETYDVTITRFVNSIVPLNADRKPADNSRFIAVKIKMDNKSSKAANPQWLLDKVNLVDVNNKIYTPITIKGEASDGRLNKDWTILQPNEEKQTYLTYEADFNTDIKKVKINLPNYPEAEWKVSVTTQ